MQTLKRPNMHTTRQYGGLLARELLEPRYWDSPDALSLFDLSHSEHRADHDAIRFWLQKRVPSRFLDKQGIEVRRIRERKAEGPLTRQSNHHLRNVSCHSLLMEN